LIEERFELMGVSSEKADVTTDYWIKLLTDFSPGQAKIPMLKGWLRSECRSHPLPH
jgi:hypothetical protein